MRRTTFNHLCESLRQRLTRQDTRYRLAVPVELRVAICLWRLATNLELRSISHLFGVGMSSAPAINDIIKPQYLHIPSAAEVREIVRGFSDRWGFPQCAGVVDGTHICIMAPPHNPADYYNRKGFYSVILQGVVDQNMKFWDVNISWSGRVHDARVSNSSLYERGQNATLLAGWQETIQGVQLVGVETAVQPSHQELEVVDGIEDFGEHRMLNGVELGFASCTPEFFQHHWPSSFCYAVASSSDPPVFCDICDERKQKAVKTCLTCQSSYCDSHLEPHHRVPRLKKHTLINAVENLEDYICQKHARPLEMFCRDDQTCVCLSCTEGEHRTHNTVPIEEESRKKKVKSKQGYQGQWAEEHGYRRSEAGGAGRAGDHNDEAEDHQDRSDWSDDPHSGSARKLTDVPQMIQGRTKKIQDIQHSVDLKKKNIEKKESSNVELFTDLIHSIERSRSDLLKMIEEQQRAAEKQAEDLIKDQQQEITELKQLSHTDDHLHVIQMCSSLDSRPHTKNWTETRIDSDVNVNYLYRALAELNKTNRKLNEKLNQTGLKFVQKFAVDVTLDPDTANPSLILSDDGKQVSRGDVKQDVPENPKRFNVGFRVLAKQGFSSGRFYYEVQVKGKTVWDLGVVRESIIRKGRIILKPEEGLWVLCLTDENQYTVHDNPAVNFPLRVRPEKVGVFVDYEEGLVSFYNVKFRSHIYSFTGQTFTEKLYPVFNPGRNDEGKNSRPLIITPLK
ncbi:E3 ubiquitin-protein ligase TRIM21-like [Rhinichthys klamathensis goyatoka]|uniref:E3 ubiquitin-protein ligase TRIM21-like n=1 Tax=Rhinichthys klamathensis goyatoka TaxID=3034132 RepID=UPI0024B4FE40|nr:E3 ubiquitin-protein ligase TRIM21-like [Rhinichthys klamathensis goyatoka]